MPDRAGLPALDKYARLAIADERRVAGHVEATRGCKHLCRHCPIPPVYGGRFFAVPAEVVLADARAQIEAGARHLDFGDPDFLNGPTHALRVTRALHAAHPDVTFSFTAKVEHIVAQAALIPELAASGALFVVSAVESLSDRVLAALAKGHQAADVPRAIAIVRAAGMSLRPTFVAFTPWTTLDDYLELCRFIRAHELEDEVDPVQLSLRLLVPPGSLLLTAPDSEPNIAPYSGRAGRGRAQLSVDATRIRAWTASPTTSRRWSRRRRQRARPRSPPSGASTAWPRPPPDAPARRQASSVSAAGPAAPRPT